MVVCYIVVNSNAGFQLPNLICTKVLEEEEESSSEDRSLSFEAVTPEQDAPYNDDNEESQIPVEKHHHILEEVDGELEMEDVAPPYDIEAPPNANQSKVTPIVHHLINGIQMLALHFLWTGLHHLRRCHHLLRLCHLLHLSPFLRVRRCSLNYKWHLIPLGRILQELHMYVYFVPVQEEIMQS